MPANLVVPMYEHPVFRFLQGTGELKIGPDGPATNLAEFLVHAAAGDYPITISGSIKSSSVGDGLWSRQVGGLRLDPVVLSRSELVAAAMLILEGGGKIGSGDLDDKVREIVRLELGR